MSHAKPPRLTIGSGIRPDKAPSEGRIQDDIREALGLEPDLVLWRNNLSTAMMPNGQYVKLGVGDVGAADLLGIFRGRFVALEVKRPGQKQRPEQVDFQNLVESKGGIYVVVESVEAARRWLEAMRKRFPNHEGTSP